MMKRIAFILVAALFTFSMWASDSTSVSHRVEFLVRGAYVMPTNNIVKGSNSFRAKTRSAFSGSVEYSFSFSPSSHYGRYYPYAYQGGGIGFTAFSSSKVTGNPLNVYVLQGSRIASFTERLSIDYEWNFGISAGWKRISNNNTISFEDIDGFGSKYNAYINLVFNLNYALTDRLSLIAGVDLSHFSNGNTDYPNPGINVLWGRFGLLWNFGALPARRSADWSDYEPHITYDVTAYGAWRKNIFNPYHNVPEWDEELHQIPGHFGVGGFNFNSLWHFNPVFSAGAALDFQYDQSANLSPYYEPSTPVDAPKFYRQPFSHRVMAGLSVRAELQMPIFSVNIGIGHSLYAPGGNDLRGWYQLFTLKTFVTRNLFISTGYRLVRFHTPGNLMLGMGWRFNAR